ncbi:hypothetical protein CLU81_2969 [Flavobacterium sp. 9]|uniref:hypothetical protein n=1 Tax=Flavobacterium sp. 9 TaxID=2035198 RepID=UPI000C180C31|nr:hypothetical protein [Flavobacterium sp. 9]PIF32440.1 hypothetical protein CLU81_2969 [Flavobacterium sp. 9]
MISRRNKIIAFLIIIINIYFIPVSVSIFLSNGGPEGVSYLILPFSILINLFFVPAVLSFKKNFEQRVSRINEVGIGLIVLILILGIVSVYI